MTMTTIIKNDKKKPFTVFSVRVANELIDKGYTVGKIDYSKNVPGKLVFMFEEGEEVKKYLERN